MIILNSDYNPVFNNWYGFKLIRLERYKWIQELKIEKKRNSFCPDPCPACIARFIVNRLLRKFVRIWRNKRKVHLNDINYRQINGRFKRLRLF